MIERRRLGLSLCAWLAISAAALAQQPVAPATPAAPIDALVVTDLVNGVGDQALSGMTVVVHYTGWLHDPGARDGRGRKFDSSRDRNQPFSFPLGSGHVIRGWELGVPGMKVGGLRRLVIAPSLAYGDRNRGDVIPANSTLLFEIELLAVETVTYTPDSQ